MMTVARRTEAAEEDLRNIALHAAISAKRPDAAERIVRKLIEQCDELARLSGSAKLGMAVPQIGDGVRAFPMQRWVILFRYQPHGIDVLRIADGNQDYFSWRIN